LPADRLACRVRGLLLIKRDLPLANFGCCIYKHLYILEGVGRHVH
jgi:hypothetical protein